jgi:hypothetical protein
LDPTLVTSHSQALSGLSPATTYDFRVLSKDAAGNQGTSANFTFATAAAGTTPLVGDLSTEASQDSNAAGLAEAFQYSATAPGTATRVYVFLDGSNAASKVAVGLYTNSASNTPGTLLAQGTIASPVANAWNFATIPGVSLQAGTKYWIAVLSPSGSGTIYIRDVASGGLAQNSSQTNLTSLPATWSPGPSWANAPMSAYAASTGAADTVPPTVSITAPASGASLTAGVTVTATASDNVAVANVQFTLDGTNLSAPVSTSPYSITWDTTTAANGTHTLAAVATDTSGNTATSAGTPVTVANPPTISGVATSALTAVSVTIKWTTNVPATSQVQYGPTTAYGTTTSLDSALVTSHSQTLTGLKPGTLYNYQVLSKDSTGSLATSANLTFTTAAFTVSGVQATAITLSSATINWSTNQPASSQVLFGTTAAYGQSTTVDSTLSTTHSQSLTGLAAGTTYHYKVVSTDVDGNTASSGDLTFATQSPVLVGDTKIESGGDSNTAGQAEAFQYTASSSGTTGRLFVYVDSGSAATSVIVGLYTNTAANSPGTLLAQATITAPTKGAWNSVAISPVSITSGTKYWIAVLGPVGAGVYQFRDVGAGGPAQNSSQTNLATLPATWSPGPNWANAPMSAYASTGP